MPAADSLNLRSLEKVKCQAPDRVRGCSEKKVRLFLLVVPAPVTTTADGLSLPASKTGHMVQAGLR